MTEGPQPAEQPPLGEPVPAVAGDGARSRYKNPFFGAAIGLLIGVVAGFVVGRSLDAGSSDESAPNPRTVQPSVVTTTVPSARALPRDCEEALRSAETVVQLLDHGFQSLRRLQIERVEEVVANLGRLRGQVTANVVACHEQLRR